MKKIFSSLVALACCFVVISCDHPSEKDGDCNQSNCSCDSNCRCSSNCKCHFNK